MGRPDLEAGLREIREDRLHGATHLAERALQLLLEASRALADLEAEEFVASAACLARELASARPAMAAVANAVCEAYALFLQGLRRCRAHPSRMLALAAHRVLRRSASKRRLAALKAAAHLKGTVITLSHSGSLALALARAPGVDQVYVAEGRPLLEGRNLAMELSAAGKAVALITEAQMRLMAERCTLAAVGADAVLADGSVVNKVGSHLLALVARDAGIPFLVVADTAKVAPRELVWGEDLMEAHPAEEVWGAAPEGIHAVNYYFERVPAPLVEAVITERGPLGEGDLLRVVEMRSRYRDLLFRHSGASPRPTRA